VTRTAKGAAARRKRSSRRLGNDDQDPQGIIEGDVAAARGRPHR
jgi:hypothetical protein